MEMEEASSFLDRRADVCFGASYLPTLRFQNGARACDHTAAIVGMIPQILLHQIRGFLVPTEIKESPRDLVIPEGLIGFGRHFSELT